MAFHKWHSIMTSKDVSGDEISEVLVSSECAADFFGISVYMLDTKKVCGAVTEIKYNIST